MADNFRVGYVPYSSDLSHPGDRRRVGTWAASKGSKLQLDAPTQSDLLVLSADANFSYWIRRSKQPVILDLVDGYLGENPTFVKDFGRNMIRSFKGKSSYSSLTFTRALKKACANADAVIVASPEQAEQVRPFNSEVHIILDDHSELDAARISRKTHNQKDDSSRYIFWEGFGYTLKHFKFISPYLDCFMHQNGYRLLVLTNPKFARWGGYLGSIDAEKLIKNWFPKSASQIEIIPWSVKEVISCASISDFAIIPVDTNDKFANLKPENKLISMWHLGLPTLFSNTKAYKRVAIKVGVSELCIDSNKWDDFFTNLSLDSLKRFNTKTEKYLEEMHTKEILVEKWQKVFETVLASNG
jgi:hypothetical protein